MKKLTLILSGLLVMILLLTQCNGDKKNDSPDTGTGTGTDSTVTSVTPVALPTNIVPGFHFPEDSTVIYKWVNDPAFKPGNYDSASIYKHAWGIWAGLTAASGQVFQGDTMPVYQTWLGLNEVQQLIIDNNTDGDCLGKSVSRKGRVQLSRPKQFEHAARFSKTSLAAFNKRGGKAPASESFDNFWVTVSYSPDAACFSTQNQIFKQSVINKYYNAGGPGAIPAFPNKSLTIKPSYIIYANTTSLLKMPVWITAPQPPNADFFGLANNYVYVDPTNKQAAGKVAIPVDSTETDSTKIAAATINLNNFIYFKVDQQMANFMNQQDSVQGMDAAGYGKATSGQLALLVAMHVTTKEISNWTWQSYYWTPNPAHPGSPSSDLAASLRPSQITGAAANYACVAAYVMLTPNNAPNNTATGSMFGYNPYLEGGFGSQVFQYPNTYNPSYQYGTQSNCMSCHALAVADTTTGSNAYSTDQTINLVAPYFNNQVSLDFAWSIQTALIHDSTPYWIKNPPAAQAAKK